MVETKLTNKSQSNIIQSAIIDMSIIGFHSFVISSLYSFNYFLTFVVYGIVKIILGYLQESSTTFEKKIITYIPYLSPSDTQSDTVKIVTEISVLGLHTTILYTLFGHLLSFLPFLLGFLLFFIIFFTVRYIIHKYSGSKPTLLENAVITNFKKLFS